jgi:hypothetical protein
MNHQPLAQDALAALAQARGAAAASQARNGLFTIGGDQQAPIALDAVTGPQSAYYFATLPFVARYSGRVQFLVSIGFTDSAADTVACAATVITAPTSITGGTVTNGIRFAAGGAITVTGGTTPQGADFWQEAFGAGNLVRTAKLAGVAQLAVGATNLSLGFAINCTHDLTSLGCLVSAWEIA